MHSPYIQVGDVRIYSITDGWFPPYRAQELFPRSTVEAWRHQHPWLDANGDVALRSGCFLIDDGGTLMLADTGFGTHDLGGWGHGRLLPALAELGVRPEHIDVVLTTHFHNDHIGGHTQVSNGGWSPTFPNARYPVRQREWDHWMSGDQRGDPTVEACILPLDASGHLELVGEAHAISEAVGYLETPGHTPGHVCIMVRSGSDGAVITGDITHNPAQVVHLDWADAVDTDLAASERSRQVVFERIANEGLTMCAGHYPFADGLGRIMLVEGRRVWQGIDFAG